MNKKTQNSMRNAAIVLTALAVIAGITVILRNRPPVTNTNSPGMIDCLPIAPGDSSVFDVGDHEVKLMVPEGEGVTFGTFQISVASLGFISDPIERNGSLENAWIFDVNGDTKEDVVFVIRNGGSGSYVDIIVLESSGNRFVIAHLPPIPAVQGYMGHDSVSIENGAIVRSFPTYANQDKARIDRQWQMTDGVKGKAPVKFKADSNAEPSGSTRELHYNYAAGQWE